MRFERIVHGLGVAACLFLAPASWAQTSEAVSRLSEHTSFSALRSDIGREPDRSEAGGACGGIVIHDWITEKIRVIALGEIVESVTALDDDSHR